MARKKKDDDTEKVDAEEMESRAAASVSFPTPNPDPPPAPKAAAPTNGTPKKYTVKAQKMISWMGCITTLTPGTIIDESGYGGQSGIQKLLDAGVVLEEIK